MPSMAKRDSSWPARVFFIRGSIPKPFKGFGGPTPSFGVGCPEDRVVGATFEKVRTDKAL
jgi:hypothetical protein